MKRFKVFIAIIMSLIIYDNLSALANEPYISCYYDSACEWQTQPPIPMICGGCSYLISYQTRICDFPYNGQPQMKITGIELNNPPCYPGCDSTALLESAYFKIFNAHPEWFSKLLPNECMLNIQSYLASCWHWVAMPGGSGYFYEPCNQLSCCVWIWFICRDGNGDLTTPQIQSKQNFIPCPAPGGGQTPCSTICD